MKGKVIGIICIVGVLFISLLCVILFTKNDSDKVKTTQIITEEKNKIDFVYTGHVKYENDDNDYKAGGTFRIEKNLNNSCEIEAEIKKGSIILAIFDYDEANGRKADVPVREEIIAESGMLEYSLDYLEEKTYWIELGRNEGGTTASATLRFIQTK